MIDRRLVRWSRFQRAMTRLLYETDPYLSRFDATVEKVQGDWVILDRTAFFPGGGGQDCRHRLDRRPRSGGGQGRQEIFGTGSRTLRSLWDRRVECEIDWERRHDLMRGHTGEHLLFSILSKMNPELELVKIAITPEKKSWSSSRGDELGASGTSAERKRTRPSPPSFRSARCGCRRTQTRHQGDPHQGGQDPWRQGPHRQHRRHRQGGLRRGAHPEHQGTEDATGHEISPRPGPPAITRSSSRRAGRPWRRRWSSPPSALQASRAVKAPTRRTWSTRSTNLKGELRWQDAALRIYSKECLPSLEPEKVRRRPHLLG